MARRAGDAKRAVAQLGRRSALPARARSIGPGSIEELAGRSEPRGGRAKLCASAGAGHSFTERDDRRDDARARARSRGVLDADRDSGLVKRAGAAHVLADLNEELAELGLALENLGDIDAQTHRRRDLDRHPRHRRAAPQHLRPGRGVELVLADGQRP